MLYDTLAPLSLSDGFFQFTGNPVECGSHTYRAADTNDGIIFDAQAFDNVPHAVV